MPPKRPGSNFRTYWTGSSGVRCGDQKNGNAETRKHGNTKQVDARPARLTKDKRGNGLRIFARYLYDHRLTAKTRFTVETAGGVVAVQLHLRGAAVDRITVEMGTATFRSDRIPVAGPLREVVDEEVEVDGQHLAVTAVSLGNPHCVVFVPDLRRVDLHHLGPRLERHPLFPKRTNVQFAQVQARDRVAALIWERGAGETLASGSSACAVAAAAVRKALVDRTLTIAMQGGDLQISVSAGWVGENTGRAVEGYA